MNRIGKSAGMIYPPMFAVLIAVCSWINIPSVVPFTMQTFGVILTLIMIGGRRGTVSLALYLFMGMIGLPVFHGFSSGPGVIMSSTGGYLLGFIFMGLIYWILTYIGKEQYWSRIAGLSLGTIACYGAGTVWFMFWYTAGTSPIDIGAALSMCVVPFVVPDIIKTVLAFWTAKKIERHTGKLY